MREIKLTPEELREAIDFGKLLGIGAFGSVFTYKGKLIKMDNILYGLLKNNDPRFTKDMIAYHYRWGKNDFNDREQLEELSKKQPYIRTKVPEGIITIKDSDESINNVSPGIIIPHFKEYKSLGEIPKDDYKRLLLLLKKVFDDIKELADNEIAQEDLFRAARKTSNNHYNIIQKDNDARIIDMSGPLVKVGKEFKNPDSMYSDYAALINNYNRENNFEIVHQEDEPMNEDKLQEMLNEFEKQTRKK